jgi:hypothetical protein
MNRKANRISAGNLAKFFYISNNVLQYTLSQRLKYQINRIVEAFGTWNQFQEILQTREIMDTAVRITFYI